MKTARPRLDRKSTVPGRGVKNCGRMMTCCRCNGRTSEPNRFRSVCGRARQKGKHCSAPRTVKVVRRNENAAGVENAAVVFFAVPPQVSVCLADKVALPQNLEERLPQRARTCACMHVCMSGHSVDARVHIQPVHMHARIDCKDKKQFNTRRRASQLGGRKRRCQRIDLRP